MKYAVGATVALFLVLLIFVLNMLVPMLVQYTNGIIR